MPRPPYSSFWCPSGAFSAEAATKDYRLHFRYQSDPPEAMTVAWFPGDQPRHWCLYRDHPTEGDSHLVEATAASGGKEFKCIGDSILAAVAGLLTTCGGKAKAAKANGRKTGKNRRSNKAGSGAGAGAGAGSSAGADDAALTVATAVSELAATHGIAIDGVAATAKWRARSKTVVGQTFNKLGIVVPVVNDVGYRPTGYTLRCVPGVGCPTVLAATWICGRACGFACGSICLWLCLWLRPYLWYMIAHLVPAAHGREFKRVLQKALPADGDRQPVHDLFANIDLANDECDFGTHHGANSKAVLATPLTSPPRGFTGLGLEVGHNLWTFDAAYTGPASRFLGLACVHAVCVCVLCLLDAVGRADTCVVWRRYTLLGRESFGKTVEMHAEDRREGMDAESLSRV